MMNLIVMFTALIASVLTFFSGFGLGTILLAAMSLFFPVAVAVVLTGLVHFLNGSLKVLLLKRHIHFGTLWRFGILAIPATYLGAWLLTKLEAQTQVVELSADLSTTPIKLTVGGLMMLFAFIEAVPQLKNLSINQKFLPLGGVLSGFFGGLTGHQGAFRAMFLIRARLSKEQYIATGSAFSFFVDLTRLSVYSQHLSKIDLKQNLSLLLLATGSALVGVLIGNKLLGKLDVKILKYIVAGAIFILGSLIALGII